MATMPSHSPHASHPSTFRAAGWGALVLLSSRHQRRNATLWKLVPFGHRSASRIFIRQPGCIPSPMVTQDGDHQFDGGEKQVGLRPPPRPQLQGFSSSGLRRRSAPSGGLPPRGSVTLFFPRRLGEKGILQARGGFLQPCRCNIPSSVRAMVAPRTGRPRPGLPRADSRARGSPSTSCAARAVLMFWGGSSEGRSEDLLVRFGAPGARWCGVEVVAAGESFSADEIANSACTHGPPSPGLNGWFSSFVGESLSAAASAWKPLLQLSCRPRRRSLSLLSERAAVSRLEFVVPRASWYGGCSYLRERNRSSVCNGALSAGVCSLWLSGPEHLCILA
jgi:hypothetical protein